MAAQSPREAGQAVRRQGDGEKLDISRDFSCFLCNGHVVVQGCITLEASFVRLSVATGRVLEEFEYSSVCSVNEEEPPTTHSLIFNLTYHSVYACLLLRKERLLKVFQSLGVYKPDVRLPAEALGFPPGGEVIRRASSVRSSPHLVYPHQMQISRPHLHTPEAGDRESWKNTRKYKNNSESQQMGGHSNFPPGSGPGVGGAGQSPAGQLQRPGREDLQTRASAARMTSPAHFNDLSTEATPPPSVSTSQTTPSNHPPSPTQQLHDLCTLFPHLSKERLRRVLEENEQDSDKAIAALMASDTLANAPRPASQSAAHTA